MPKVDVEKLRGLSQSMERFLSFEREIEDGIRNEDVLRKEERDEEKRAREKRARKKRLKKLRQMQHQ